VVSKVVLDVAMSLDGFTAGPDIGAANPMGKGGERLHEWMWTAGNGPDGGVDAGFSPANAAVGAAVIGLLLGEGTPLFAGERGELIPEGKPIAGAVTHLRYRVAKPSRP
jgi:hypothetical protein